jgi:hypothetical protein
MMELALLPQGGAYKQHVKGGIPLNTLHCIRSHQTGWGILRMKYYHMAVSHNYG